METQFEPIPIQELISDWQRLKCAMYELGDIQPEFFLKTFVGTEAILRSCLAAEAVEKQYIPLIMEASGFVDAHLAEAPALVKAAKVLTERMLYQYLVCDQVTPANAHITTIYSLELRRHLTLDFYKPRESIAAITQAF